MSQWRSYANSSGAPKWGAVVIQQGSGKANIAANNVALVVNTTPGAWKAQAGILNQVDGVFPVTPYNKANTSGESAKVHGLGWALRKEGLGPITTIAAANGAGFANGDTASVSGGSGANAILVLTTNTTGNLVSASIYTQGLFANVSSASEGFNRDQHVANLNFANSTALTGVGNGNTINVTISANSTTGVPWGKSATGSFTSNSTGGISNTQTQAITWQLGNNAGIFSNAVANASLVITLTNANGTAVGGTYTVTANLATSTGGFINVTGVGGRSGRVTYEMLVIDRHIANGASGSVANTTQLPQ